MVYRSCHMPTNCTSSNMHCMIQMGALSVTRGLMPVVVFKADCHAYDLFILKALLQ